MHPFDCAYCGLPLEWWDTRVICPAGCLTKNRFMAVYDDLLRPPVACEKKYQR